MKEKGIKIGGDYRITTLDKLNVVVQKYSPSKEIVLKDGSKKLVDASWNTYSYHANVKQAITSIAREQINLTVEAGAKAVIDKINELEECIKNIKVVDINE